MRCEARTGRAGLQPGHKGTHERPFRAAAGRSRARRASRPNCLCKCRYEYDRSDLSNIFLRDTDGEEKFHTYTGVEAIRRAANAIPSFRPVGFTPACGSEV